VCLRKYPVISSPFWGVSDVADEIFWSRGGHVLLSGVRSVADVAVGLAASVGHLFPLWCQRVLMPVTGTESWTVIGDDGAVVAPVERYLAYLSALERSPNTGTVISTALSPFRW
jgi:hypothetical protein